ncbi:unnamed protein product [Dracunculus medinensis]|uniref:Matrin-type domain-containing protein n=1 Tax=Dracunculus medinensis TaxID=318479 RepID=A0A0N4UK02_DRAME|nr:unnamed protein product [Dracunculus medinensis]
MTDVWKSNARKFCELCKVWFADNSVSIQHHEAGQKHKAAIQAKLREVGKQSNILSFKGDIIGPSLKPKSYLDPRAHKASVVSMAKEISKQKSEVRLMKATFLFFCLSFLSFD